MKHGDIDTYVWVGGSITVLAVLFAILGFFWQPFDPLAIDLAGRFADPSLFHPLGKDGFGRDMLSRIMAGAWKSLTMGFGATLLAMAIGIPIALFVGYMRGLVDQVIMRVVDVFLSIPSLIFALIMVVSLGTSHMNALIALGIASTPRIVRIIRTTVIDTMAHDYVTAARARGETALFIQYREVLPNIWPPIIIEGSINVGFALMAGAALSYLGLGTQPPAADWGLLVRDGQQAINQSIWPLLGPAIMISIAIVGFNLLGEGLRDQIAKSGVHGHG